MTILVCARCQHGHAGGVCDCGCEDWSELVDVLDSQPSSPERAPVTDAEHLSRPLIAGEAEQIQGQAELHLAHWQDTLRLLAARARDQARIVALSRKVHIMEGHPITPWEVCGNTACVTDRALLAQEVPDNPTRRNRHGQA